MDGRHKHRPLSAATTAAFGETPPAPPASLPLSHTPEHPMVAEVSLMDNDSLRAALDRVADSVKGRTGCWNVQFDGRRMLVITDETCDRFRIMAPVIDDIALDPVDLQVLMTANFDRTLDARYATSGGYLWAIYLHPLGELTEKLLVSGLEQVKNLVDNFGRSFASSDLKFTGGQF
jgi:hypothetical protein